MGLEKERKMLMLPKVLFNISMMNPQHRWRRNFSIITSLILNMILIYLSFKLVQENNYTVSSVANGIRAVSGYVQLFPKLIIYLRHEDDIKKLEESINEFWTTDTNINDDIFAVGFFVSKSFSFLMGVSLVAIWTFPIFANTFFFDMWVPDFNGAFAICWILQSYQILIVICAVISADLLFISSCVNAIGQLNILNYNIEKLKTQEDGDVALLVINMKKCIEHHKFVLGYIDNLMKCFSLSLLIQYLMSMYQICIILYAISELEEWIDYISNALLISALITQVACYCFPADAVIEAAKKTSTALYSCEWYNFPIPIQKNILQVMTCVQKDLQISAGGLLFINKETFTTTLKSAFSLYTAMKGLKDK